jgi:IPT/TIG domain/Bacterial TSP3 repeat
MMRRTLLALIAAVAALVAASPALAKSHKKPTSPVVTRISPLSLNIGQKLTIRGSGFVSGKKKDTVVFMGAGRRVVWVKADKASSKTITVRLPDTLSAILTNSHGTLLATKLQVRVIAKRSGRAFTKLSRSPKVGPKNGVTPGGTGGCVPNPSNPSADSDGDMLPDALEVALGTDPCKYDTDGDGVSDGYEYQSALDLNRNANSSSIPWPYPGKKPYPNPLDPSDANTDFDGDSLTLKEEYTASFAWKLGIDPAHTLQTFLPYAPSPNPNNNIMVVAYSDGDQTTNPAPTGNPIGDPMGPAAPLNPTDQSPYDVNGDGVVNAADTYGFVDVNPQPGDTVGVYDPGDDITSWFNYTGQSFLSDDEKDVDGDGLSNYDEAHGPLSGPDWWTKSSLSKNDGTYYIPYTGTNWLDRDTDGDGIPDGADDQDHDGYTNIEEDYGAYVAGPFMAWAAANHQDVNVHAFNPCYPNVLSPACTRHPDANASYGPFKPGSRPPTWAHWPAP